MPSISVVASPERVSCRLHLGPPIARNTTAGDSLESLRPSISSRTISACPRCCAVSPTINTNNVPSVASWSLRPMGHVTGTMQVKLTDGAVGMGARGSVHTNDVAAGFVGRRPHVDLVVRVVAEPGRGLGRMPPEGPPKVAVFLASQVLHQTEQIRSSRRQRSSQVVLRQPVERGLHPRARATQPRPKLNLQIAHNTPLGRRRYPSQGRRGMPRGIQHRAPRAFAHIDCGPHERRTS